MTLDLSYTHKEAIDIQNSRIYARIVAIDSSRTPAKTISLVLDTGAFITLLKKDHAQRYGYKIVEEKGCNISGFSEKGLVCDLRRIPTIPKKPFMSTLAQTSPAKSPSINAVR